MGALVDKLQNLFSKHFIIGTFLPVFVTALLNAMLLYVTNDRARDWFRMHYPKGTLDAVLTTGTASLFLIVGAFILSSSTTYLREILEGRHYPRSLQGLLAQRHSLEMAALRRKLSDLRRDHERLAKYCGNWSAILSCQLRHAQRQPAGTLRVSWDPQFVWPRELRELRELYRQVPGL